MKRITVILVMLVTTLAAHAQMPKQFPSDDAGFLAEFLGMFTKTNRPDLKELAAAFEVAFPGYSAASKEAIKKSAQALLAKKAQISPTFDRFAKTVIELSKPAQNAGIVEQSLSVMPRLLDKLASGNFKDFNKYLDFITTFHKSGAILEMQSKSWRFNGSVKVTWENEQPAVQYSKGTLIGSTKGDSIQVLETSGTYFPLTDDWAGREGKITWARAGLDPTKAFATFGKYNFNLQRTDFSIDTVQVTLLPYVRTPVKGTLQDKLFTAIDKGSFNYPRFNSFSKKVAMEPLAPELKYDGGIAVEGAQIIVTGSDTARAKLTVSNKAGEELVVAKAYKFYIKNFEEISSGNATLKLIFKGGEIQHPSTIFNYSTKTRRIKLSRAEGAYQKVPFESVYHGMNIFAGGMDYHIDSSFARLVSWSAGGEATAIFESKDFYVKDMERRYRGVTNYDPLSVIKKYCEDNNTYTIPFDYIPGMLGYAVTNESAERLLYRMTEDGYVNYDPISKVVEVYDKTFKHIKAGQNLVDYDVIRFESKVVKDHGRLNVKDGSLAVYGVKKIRFSGAQKVFAQPLSDTIIIGQDRNLKINGVVYAGKMNIYSKDIRFNYDEFKIDFPKIDSFYMMVLDRLPGIEGNYDYVETKTAINNISGELKIDYPDNKGSARLYSSFPVFTAKDSAKVFYSSSSEKYDSSSFYFEVYPFEIDSLNEVAAEKVTFDGKLNSGGIFEPFESKLGVQSDISLGFKHTFQKPVKMFNNAGNFQGDIYLNSAGLSAKGTLVTRAATFAIDTAMYYPDSVNAQVASAIFTADTKNGTPDLSGTAGRMIWMPKQDSLYLFKMKEPIAMYSGGLKFTGSLKYGNKYMLGSGSFSLGDGNLRSTNIQFRSTDLSPSVARLDIIPEGVGKPVFSDSLLTGTINFETQKATFRQTKDTVSTILPQLNYRSTAAGYDWDIKNRQFTMLVGNNQRSFNLLALSPELDSLSFDANRAVLDIPGGSMQVYGIKDFAVADSRVIPDSNMLSIENTGKLRSLTNAQLVMNSEKVNHTIANGSFDIPSRKKISGEGVMEYNSLGKAYKVKISDIKVVEKIPEAKGKKSEIVQQTDEPRLYITANGTVPENDQLRLGEKIFYKGNLLIRSYRPGFDLKGFGKLDISTDIPPGWFRLEQALDLQHNALPIDSLKDEGGQQLYTGMFLDLNDLSFSPKFMYEPVSLELPVMAIKGAMKYDAKEQKWQFGEEDVLAGKQLLGNLMTYDEQTRDITYAGEFAPAFEFNEVKLGSFVQLKKAATDTAYDISAAVGFNFLLDPLIWDMLARDIQEFNTKAQPVTIPTNKFLHRAVYNMYADKQYALDQAKNLETNGSFIPGEKWQWPLFISDLKLQWDPLEGSWKSAGPATVFIMGNKQVKQRVRCFLEMGYSRGADYFNLYIETANGAWYFFNYSRDELYTRSSDEKYNEAVTAIKANKRTVLKNKELVYLYDVANSSMVNIFIERMTSYMNSFSNN